MSAVYQVAFDRYIWSIVAEFLGPYLAVKQLDAVCRDSRGHVYQPQVIRTADRLPIKERIRLYATLGMTDMIRYCWRTNDDKHTYKVFNVFCKYGYYKQLVEICDLKNLTINDILIGTLHACKNGYKKIFLWINKQRSDAFITTITKGRKLDDGYMVIVNYDLITEIFDHCFYSYWVDAVEMLHCYGYRTNKCSSLIIKACQDKQHDMFREIIKIYYIKTNSTVDICVHWACMNQDKMIIDIIKDEIYDWQNAFSEAFSKFIRQNKLDLANYIGIYINKQTTGNEANFIKACKANNVPEIKKFGTQNIIQDALDVGFVNLCIHKNYKMMSRFKEHVTKNIVIDELIEYYTRENEDDAELLNWLDEM